MMRAGIVARWLLSAALRGQCVPEPIETENVEGYTLYHGEGAYVVLGHATVRLFGRTGPDGPIASAHVDRDGHFKGNGAGIHCPLLRIDSPVQYPGYRIIRRRIVPASTAKPLASSSRLEGSGTICTSKFAKPTSSLSPEPAPPVISK